MFYINLCKGDYEREKIFAISKVTVAVSSITTITQADVQLLYYRLTYVAGNTGNLAIPVMPIRYNVENASTRTLKLQLGPTPLRPLF